MRVPRALYPLSLAALAGLAGCGSPEKQTAAGEPTASSARVIEMKMADNQYAPKQISVHRGETVTLRFTNTGAVRHEALVAPEEEQQAHDARMATMTTAAPAPEAPPAQPVPADGGGAGAGLGAQMGPMPGMDHGGMEHGGAHGGMDHGGGSAVTVEPGATAELTYTFTGQQPVVIGCHEPGHWASGMKATVLVT